MRKRYLYIIVATVVAALASACMKDEADKPVISFSPVASKATKAIISGNDYPTGESFVVSAYHEGTDAYFEDLTASYNSTLHLWETSESQYWPLGGSLTFNAYSPAAANGVSIDASGITASNYTIQTSEQMTTDLCYATATVDDCATHPDAVTLTFSHALSQVVFRVKAAGYYSTNTNTVSLAMTSLSLAGIYSVGDFTSANGWENQDTERTYSLSNSSTVLTYNNREPNTIEVCSNLFIPQELGANAAITVGYSITQTANSTYTLTNAPVTIPLGTGINEWLPGKKYIYTLNIGMNNVITFTASTVGWQDENDNIIVEEN